jgi:hypothetical protein
MEIDGACHCGYITIKGEADPQATTICHCTDCQTGAGSAFRVSVPVSGVTFKLTGQPANYLKTSAESGNPRLQGSAHAAVRRSTRRRRAKAHSRRTWCASASCVNVSNSVLIKP